MIKDYDCEILYHPGKANVVVDALSRKGREKLMSITTQEELIRDMERLELEVSYPRESDEKMFLIEVSLTLMDRIKEAQEGDQECMGIKKRILDGEDMRYKINGTGLLCFEERIWIPMDEALKEAILHEAHNSRFSVHPGSTKMFQDLRQRYWWPNMKREVAEFVERCLTCQQVKAEHQRPSGLLQPLEIPVWVRTRIFMK